MPPDSASAVGSDSGERGSGSSHDSSSASPEWTAAIATRVVIVAGKGGVGKTTVTAVLARAAARLGQRVLVIELDGKPMLDGLLAPASSPGDEGPGSVELTRISAPDALDEYLREHGFARVAKRLQRTGVIDVVGTAAPGIDDVVVLGKVKQLERTGGYDLIVVDGPAAGHAITFLTSAKGLADAVRGGPVKSQSDDVLELLTDHDRCQVVLVTLPETTPVNEVVETAYALEDEVGIQLGPVVVNAVDDGAEPPDDESARAAVEGLDAETADALLAAARFRRSRQEMERRELDRLAAQLPLPRIALPALSVAGLSHGDLDALVDALTQNSGDSWRVAPRFARRTDSDG